MSVRKIHRGIRQHMARWASRWSWKTLTLWALSAVPMVLLASGAVFAANVQYGTPNGAANTVVVAGENIAATIRDVLGATALVAFLSAALVNHFVHDQHAKERAKEIMWSAVVGLLVAAFAPTIVNWFLTL